MVFVPQSDVSAGFLAAFQDKVAASSKFTLLTSGIRGSYQREVQGRRSRGGVALLSEGEQPASDPGFFAGVTVFQTDVTTLLASPVVHMPSDVLGVANIYTIAAQ